MASGKKPSAEDIELFRRSVGPVRKIHNDRTAPARKALPPRPRHRYGSSEAQLSPDSFSDGFDAGSVSPEEELFFARPGLQQRQLQRLRRGQLTCSATLDLHGMTAATARGEIITFIASCRAQQIRCVHIIHGKGYGSGGDIPVLKNRLNSWLRQHHDVLAFCSAQPRDGGRGALYVLLRSQR
jgi:DNA-nicking Smr family endonuclease